MSQEDRAQALYEQHRSEDDPDWSELPEHDRTACMSAAYEPEGEET